MVVRLSLCFTAVISLTAMMSRKAVAAGMHSFSLPYVSEQVSLCFPLIGLLRTHIGNVELKFKRCIRSLKPHNSILDGMAAFRNCWHAKSPYFYAKGSDFMA